MPLLIQPYGALSLFATAVVVFGFGVLGLGGLLLFAVARWRAFRLRALAAERAASAETSLRPGLTTLNGVVEFDEEDPDPHNKIEVAFDTDVEPNSHKEIIHHETIALEMTIRERREQPHGRAHYTLWVEKERSVTVRPFNLVLAQGTRVRVEPDEHVLLVAPLETKEAGLIFGERTRRALLKNGDRASVCGILRRDLDPELGGAGYRASGEALLLVPPRDERMLVSIEPLPERHARRARLHRAWAWRFVVALILFHAIFGAFHRSLLFGTSTDAAILRTGERTATSSRYRGTGGGPHTISSVILSHPETGREVTLDTSVDLHGQSGKRVVVRYVPGTTLIGLGEYPTENFSAGVLASAAVLVLGVVYVVHVLRSRLWYERRRVVETEE